MTHPTARDELREAAQAVVLAAKKMTPEIMRLNAALAAARSEAPGELDAELLRSWAGSVRRLIETAPTRAVIDETGIVDMPHSTPEERRLIRDAGLATVDRWLDRDLARLREARS
jgi:hypothetical protein